MTTEQWELLLQTVHAENDSLQVGLIVDSPWIPGYLSMNTIDFFAQPDAWFNAYCRIKADFTDMLFLPDWWAEYGMATEPSGFGGKISFQKDVPPNMHHIIEDADDLEGLAALEIPNPEKDGLMPLLLSWQRYVLPKIHERGEQVKIVSTRGPLTIASHLMGVSEFLTLIKTEPDAAHGLLQKTTALCIRWLAAQLENLHEAEGILMLDDISGFLGEGDYLEFAHPYLKQVMDAYRDKLRLFHNDSDNDVIFPHLADMGVQVFNPTYKRPIGPMREKIGREVVILGALRPLLLADGTPESVAAEARGQLAAYAAANGGSLKGLILSAGGGAPMGARRENIEALMQTAREFTVA